MSASYDDFEGDHRHVVVTPGGLAAIVPKSVQRLGGEALEHFAWLQRTRIDLDMLEAKIEQAIPHARGLGLSWSTIGSALGMTGEGARQRFGDLDD